MKCRWIQKNVNLDQLRNLIIKFFEEQEFKTKSESTSDRFSLVGIRRLSHDQVLKVDVTLSGHSNDFSVDLNTGKDKSSLLFSSMFSYLGSGGLLLRNHKSFEHYQRLEESFIGFLDRTISQLTNSASLS